MSEPGDGTGPRLGAAVRRLRETRGYSQEELARRVGDGMRQPDVSRLERGDVTLPGRARLERLAAALGVSAGQLLAESGWGDVELEPAPPDVTAQPFPPGDPRNETLRWLRRLDGDPRLWAGINAMLRVAAKGRGGGALEG